MRSFCSAGFTDLSICSAAVPSSGRPGGEWGQTRVRPVSDPCLTPKGRTHDPWRSAQTAVQEPLGAGDPRAGDLVGRRRRADLQVVRAATGGRLPAIVTRVRGDGPRGGHAPRVAHRRASPPLRRHHPAAAARTRRRLLQQAAGLADREPRPGTDSRGGGPDGGRGRRLSTIGLRNGPPMRARGSCSAVSPWRNPGTSRPGRS